MSLTKLSATVTNVGALENLPNDTSGLTATQLKAVFDKAGVDIKDYINNTLTSELDSTIVTTITSVIDDLIALNSYQVADIKYVATTTAPSGWLKCNDTAVSRTTYADLFNAICPAQTFTVTIASPAVFSATAHGLSVGDPVRFSTTGALPTGLSASTTYYVISAGFTANAFQVSTSVGGGAVNTSGTQSGTHTLRPFYFGVGDGSTTFNVPDLRGEFIRGWDDGRSIDTSRVFGSAQTDDLEAHSHDVYTNDGTSTNAYGLAGGTAEGVSGNAGGTGGYATDITANSQQIIKDSGGAETRPRNIAMLAVIKY